MTDDRLKRETLIRRLEGIAEHTDNEAVELAALRTLVALLRFPGRR